MATGPGRGRWRGGTAAVAAAVGLLGLACAEARRAEGAPAARAVRGSGGREEAAPLSLRPIPATQLRVTLGRIAEAEGGRYRVESAKMRAEAPGYRRSAAGLRFTYLGPTAAVARLASGEERRQLGLKLKARDGCNLVYVMWRVAPVPGVVVQVKENPGASTHEECGAGGYRTVRPLRGTRPPLLVPGASHLLVARLEGTRLVVEIDGTPVWEGRVDAAAAALEGPIGIRTDNVRADLELLGTE